MYQIFECFQFYTRINKDGYFVVKSEKTRSQLLNKADAIAYIRSVIFKLEAPEKVTDEETIEKHNRNKYKATRLRLMEKRSHSLLKSYRSQS